MGVGLVGEVWVPGKELQALRVLYSEETYCSSKMDLDDKLYWDVLRSAFTHFSSHQSIRLDGDAVISLHSPTVVC